MKTRQIIICCLTGMLACFHMSCETKYSQNGNLDGMWQMLRWEDTQHQTVKADKNDGYYYCFQFNLMKVWQAGKPQFYYLSYFTHKGDSLILGDVFSYPGDSVRTFTDLMPYGVPSDGRFHVDKLNADKMVLSREATVLTFRKY